MLYNALIIVESQAKLANNLVETLCKDSRFEYLRLISDNPLFKKKCFISKENMSNISNRKFEFMIEKREYKYAIFKAEFENIVNRNCTPVILLSLEHYFMIIKEIEEITQWTFFSILVYEQQQKIDDGWKKCTYSIVNKSLEDSYKLIIKLWELKNTGGGLSRDLMEKMIACDLLIKNGAKENISNASYDLSLGDEYYYAGKIGELNDKNPFLAIEPYDYVIASCAEKVQIPRDVEARFDVSVKLFCQGIILSNSTQVDPGFRGKLFCLLFNTSNKVVYLKRKMHYATLEFNKLVEPTTAYSGQYADEDSIVPYLPANLMQGAINELKKEIEKLQAENQKMQGIYLSALALFLALVSIFLVFR